MSIYETSLDLKKSFPIYNDPIVLRQGDTNVEILVHIFDNSTPKNLENLPIEFHADKPDATTIDDDEQSHFQIGADKESFTYTVPDELTDASGSTSNTYFKIGNDSTSNFYIHILTKAGMEKLESGDYISKVDRIFNHVMSDYSAINNLSETAAATLKASLDKMSSDYADFINSKNTDFKTYLAALDSQAADVKNKYTALKSQLDALEVPVSASAFQSLQTQVNNSAVGTNLLIGTVTPVSIKGNNSGNQVSNTYALVGGMNAYNLYRKYGSKFTLSYDWSVTDTASAYTGGMQQQFNSTPWGFNDVTTISSSNTSGHKVATITLANSSANTATALQFHLANVPTTSTITVSNMKLEKGSVATDWTPAPEDKANVSDTNDLQNKYTALQTQVNNSAVGTNLLLGTGDNLSITGTNIPNQTMNSYLLTNGYSISSLASALGKQFTISLDWSVSGSSPSGSFLIQWDSSPWDLHSASTTVSSSNASGHFSNTFSVSADSINAATRIGFRLNNLVGTLTVSNIKLEKGSVATDWCPNPAEILTQSDYAKIKAAILSLGGSLS
ncbi:phage baseplate upper protein [Companilactobacillus crustorum]|uniref:BppU family phage baseplate upper protein n=1 Tax=Companilactobacillus crustorum TaxID=392416 RepID=UPI00237D8F60|nr:BppU family phage baseplate upper protein [Companilactobacillus crustorum]WDT64704.1 phage baseplate upper protein [Companilactobacillus crustorum]